MYETIVIKSGDNDLYFRFKCIYCRCEFLRNASSDRVQPGYYVDKPLLWGDGEEKVESKLGVITKCPACGRLIGTESKTERYDVRELKDQ